jgi:uncharacterized membrane protein HdeD (DUF308 family)
MSEPSARGGGADAADLTGPTPSRGMAIALGLVTLVLGILVIAWPGETLLVVAVLVGIQLLVAGIFRLIAAFMQRDAHWGGRLLYLAGGLLTVIAGILCLRSPFLTISVIALILGLTWVVSGVIEIFQAFGPHRPSWLWRLVSGCVTTLAGIVVLAFPVTSLVGLAWFVGVLLVVIAVATILSALMGGQQSAAPGSGRAVPATP